MATLSIIDLWLTAFHVRKERRTATNGWASTGGLHREPSAWSATTTRAEIQRTKGQPDHLHKQHGSTAFVLRNVQRAMFGIHS